MSAVETKPGLRELTAEMFRSAVGVTFIFKRPAEQQTVLGGCVGLKLVEVKSFEHRVPAGRVSGESGSANFRAPFSLLFELPDGMAPLGLGLHRIEHPDFLPEDWHVARVHVFGRDPKKAYYESVFG